MNEHEPREWLRIHPAANMGAVTREQVEAFADHVQAEYEKPFVWCWSAAGPSICKGSKIILLRETLIGQYPWVAYQEMLHEVSHLDRVNGHGPDFHAVYAELVGRFLTERDSWTPHAFVEAALVPGSLLCAVCEQLPDDWIHRAPRV